MQRNPHARIAAHQRHKPEGSVEEYHARQDLREAKIVEHAEADCAEDAYPPLPARVYSRVAHIYLQRSVAIDDLEREAGR